MTARENTRGKATSFDPADAVRAFYKALNKHRCDEAIKIRPDYDLMRCSAIDTVIPVTVETLNVHGNRAVIYLSVVFQKGGQKERFKGYLWLQQENDGLWRIQPDFVPEDQISAADFMRDKAGIDPGASAAAPKPKGASPEATPPSHDEEENQGPDLSAPLDASLKPHPKPAPSPPLPLTGKPIDFAGIRSFGSEKILAACWTPEELRGRPADKKIVDNKGLPDHSPPLSPLPQHRPGPLPARLRGSIRSVRIPDPNKKWVALTFDLCERASETTGFDPDILNYLRQHRIKATFYAGGKWMRSHPDKTQQLMADPLFEIGNHAWTHGNMRVLEGGDMQAQVLWTQAEYERLRGDLARRLPQCGLPPEEIDKVPPLPLSFRYPYGTCSREALEFMESYGLPSVQWSIVTADPWRKQTAEGIANTILQQVRPGAIIIAHANGRGWKTSEALPKFVPELIAMGYEFVTVTELLNAGEAQATDTCYELKPGDNQFYDRKVGRGTD